MNDTCICDNVPKVWRLTGVTRTLRLRIFNPDGTPLDLTGRTVAVTIARDNSEFVYAPGFVIEGDDNNVVKFEWPADQQGAGDYTINVTTTDGSGNADRVNWHGPTGIRLVDFSFMVRGEDALGVTSEANIGLDGTFTMNGAGMSAYDEWLVEGHTGTPEDFIAWLRQPAEDAATEAEATVDAKMAEVDADMAAIEATAAVDHARAENDHTTATGDHTRAEADHAQAVTDSQQAATDHQQAESDAAAAASDREKAATDRTKAANDRQQAAADHATAAQDHATASSDHQQAQSDHIIASEDHTQATQDAEQAASDHTRADDDHDTAVADHQQAEADHTRAEADHTTAAADHTTAASDHTQATADHEVMAGYDTRLGNVEGEVSQLGQEATKGYVATEQTPSPLTKLQIDPSTNTFKSTTSGSVRVYYVPCTSGQSFRVTATGSSSAVFRAAYSAAVPAAGGDLTVLFNENLSAVDFIAEAPADGYFSVYCNATTFPNVKIYSVVFTDLYNQIVQNSANIAANKAEVDAKIAGLSGQILACIRLVGEGTTLVVSDNQTSIIEGHTYRFYLKNWPFGHGGSYHVFEVVAVDSNDVETVLVYERGDSLTPKDYYEAVIPAGTVAIKIKGRVASSTTGECYIQDVTALYNKSTHLKICILGNSYSADAWRYVPLMLLDYGITCEIDFYYRGSGSLHDLDVQWLSDSATDISYEDGNQHSRFHFVVDSRTFPLGYKWIVTTRMSAHDIVALKQWDIITLQQRGNGGYSADLQYYEPYLQEVLEKIFAICNYPVALWWFNSYNGVNDDGAAMNEASIQTQGEVFHSYPFDNIIPAGTAVFDARLNPTLAALGDSEKMMGPDGIHLQEGLPCYVAALTVVQAILDKYKPGKSVFGNTFRATAENIADCGMDKTVNGDSTGVTDANCLLAQKAAIVARNSPFTIIGI